MVVKIHGSIGPRSLSCCGLPPCECATVFMLRFSQPCGCATVFMLRFSRPVDVPQSLCCVIFALVRLPRSFVDLVILTTLFGVFDWPLPKLLMNRDRRFLSVFLLGGSVRLAGSV
jgi:hypothetical protein